MKLNYLRLTLKKKKRVLHEKYALNLRDFIAPHMQISTGNESWNLADQAAKKEYAN